MKKVLVILLSLLSAFFLFACSNGAPNALYLDISDVTLDTYVIEGKSVVDLLEFSDYLNVSKHRFELDTKSLEKGKLTIKNGYFAKAKDLQDHKKLTEEELKNFEKKSVSVKYGKEKFEIEIYKSFNNLYASVEDLSKIFKFKTESDTLENDKEKIKVSKIIFDDPDTKKTFNASNVDYDWYMDQAHTGEYCDGNCGPTSVAMAMKWVDENSSMTGERARSEDPVGGNWWSTDNIKDSLRRHEINHEELTYFSAESITDLIDEGKIAILCLKMGEISENKNPDSSNIGRFYGFDGGHFLIVKGYQVVDGKLYYEVYDPNNWDMKYSNNNEPMGRDRLYLASEVDNAVRVWWIGIISVSK